jgi:TonB family protein
MSERSKNRKKELEDFLRYSQDQMSEEERNAFEKSLQQDPFDAEAMEGLSSITPEEARADVAGLRNKLHRRITRSKQTTRNTRTMWYRIAAAVTVLLVVTSVLFTIFSDRMGQLDRKVAESPEVEKEVPAEPTEDISPIQSLEDSEETTEPDQAAGRKSDENTGTEPVKQEPTRLKAREAETEAELRVEKITVEPAAGQEMAIIQFEEEADINAAKAAVAEEIHADEVAAPAMAMESKAAAKSRKRATAEQMQMAGAVAAGQRIVSGVVISGEDEQPLPGVIVAVKGSNTGTVTDLEGQFQISIEDDSMSTLIAQFIGMEPKEIPIQDQEELMITLEPDVVSLEEVVLIETGSSKIAQPAGDAVKVSEYTYEQKDQDYHSATPVGGKKDFNEYVKDNIQFPEHGEVLTRAVVVLNFVVGNNGRPAQVLVLKSPGKAFSDEAIRLLMDGPDWQPADVQGVQIEQTVRIRIVFKND